MANINFRFLADNSQLTRATRKAGDDLGGAERAAKKVGAAIKGAFAIAGIGLGIDAIVSGLKDISKAAIDDNKSQSVLAKTMLQTVGSSEAQVAQAEKFINAMQRQTNIVDDKLRPAFSTLVVATKDAGKAQELLTLASDVSAGTGKDLTTVTAALAKAYNGQFTSLNKLVPGITAAKDPMEALATTYAGMAKTAADEDPIAKMTVVFGDLQEELGKKFLPILEDIANWIAGPEGTKMLNGFVEVFGFVVGLALEAAKAVQSLWDTFAQSPEERAFKEYQDAEKRYNERKDARHERDRVLADEKRSFYHKEVKAAIDAYSPKSGKSIPSIFLASANAMRDIGNQFRSAIDLSSGLNQEGDKFDMAKVMPGVAKMVAAAKKLPGLLKRLKAGGADQNLLSQIINMGPIAGAATASGLIMSGQLGEFVTAQNQLSMYGAKAGAVSQLGTGTNTYAININKANMTAEEIIAAIQKYERKTGKKVVLGG